MATIPVGGLATGLDTNGLVEKLMAVDRQSVTLMRQAAQTQRSDCAPRSGTPDPT